MLAGIRPRRRTRLLVLEDGIVVASALLERSLVLLEVRTVVPRGRFNSIGT
jgi:hypothetical protein